MRAGRLHLRQGRSGQGGADDREAGKERETLNIFEACRKKTTSDTET